MKYLETAFQQLQFAIKLMVFAESGGLKREDLDIPLRIEGGPSILVLQDQVLSSQHDLILACQNHVSMAFGAAAITLNRSREESNVPLPSRIEDERSQWIALVYHIRNAFAHDISEPKWRLRRVDYARLYRVGGVVADLAQLDGIRFDYSHIGGPEALFWLKHYGVSHVLGAVTA
jgi:hypothetical protein